MATMMRTNEDLEMLMLQTPEFTGYVNEYRERVSTRCRRCGGFLVRDCNWHTACRCIQCGDVIDPVILRNRALAVAHFKDEPRHKQVPVVLRRLASVEAIDASSE